MAAAGITVLLQAQGPGRFPDLQHQARRLFARLHSWNPGASTPPPMLIGGAAFFPDPIASPLWQGFPSAALVLPRLALTRSQAGTFLSVNLPVEPGETLSEAARRAEREAQDILTHLETFSSTQSLPVLATDWSDMEGDQSAWNQTVQQALDLIHQGYLRKVVLARTLTVSPQAPLELCDLLQSLEEICPHCFRFLLEFQPGVTFAGATPERLVSIQRGFLRTAAIAGSIRRGLTAAEDENLGAELLQSDKDRREHALVADYLRARLAPLTADLYVAETPGLLRLPNIQHLWTPIQGRLRSGCGPMDVLAALHPTPAVGGLPLDAALDFIRRHEGFERGWYAGPIGWLDAQGNADFAVAIRSALVRSSEMTLFAGAGIVAGSDPDREWEEIGLKLQFLLQALQRVMA